MQKKFCHTDENKFSSPSNAGFQNRGLKFAYLVQSMENEVLGIEGYNLEINSAEVHKKHLDPKLAGLFVENKSDCSLAALLPQTGKLKCLG